MRSPGQGYPDVWEAVTKIPRGRVATYGTIASLCGRPGHARFVGYALHHVPPGSGIPWQRVINARGVISLPGRAGERQRLLLEKEGVVFSGKGIDLKRFGWNPLSRRRRKLRL